MPDQFADGFFTQTLPNLSLNDRCDPLWPGSTPTMFWVSWSSSLDLLERPLRHRLDFSILDLMQKGNVFRRSATITPNTLANRCRSTRQASSISADLGQAILIDVCALTLGQRSHLRI